MPEIMGSSESMRMALLTASLVGIQFTWGIEMTYCTPYLLKLGLSKANLSIVWTAGPLSGLIMHPVVGIIADRSTSRFGRRRPFMVAGTAIVLLSLLLLGWTKEVVAFLGITEAASSRTATIFLAVMSIYGIDFAINAVQASARGLIVDTLPASKQQLGSAWASRMVAMGSLIGYAAGALDLGHLFGNWIGETQFQRLIVVAAVCLCATVGVTCWSVEETPLVAAEKDDDSVHMGVAAMFRQIVSTALNLPDRISAICWVQFWSWIGWFPFLFYTTTFIGETYLRYDAPAHAQNHSDALGLIGRLGSLSLLTFSVITFAGSVMIPWIVESPETETAGFTPRPPASIAGFLLELEKYKPSLATAWTYAHLIFAVAMSFAPFVKSYRAATLIVAICGVPWAIACWAPFTFMGTEINKLSNGTIFSNGATTKQRDSIDLEEKPRITLRDPVEKNDGQLAGVYLGILNLYTTLPQFLGTFISWAVFSVLEPGKQAGHGEESPSKSPPPTEGPNAIAVCLFIGAMAAFMAARATLRLRRMMQSGEHR